MTIPCAAYGIDIAPAQCDAARGRFWLEKICKGCESKEAKSSEHRPNYAEGFARQSGDSQKRPAPGPDSLRLSRGPAQGQRRDSLERPSERPDYPPGSKNEQGRKETPQTAIPRPIISQRTSRGPTLATAMRRPTVLQKTAKNIHQNIHKPRRPRDVTPAVWRAMQGGGA